MITEEQRKEISRIDRAIRGAQDSAEISAASISVIGAGLVSLFGLPVSPEMVAASASMLAGIANRIRS